jgi:hypothetical protein
MLPGIPGRACTKVTCPGCPDCAGVLRRKRDGHPGRLSASSCGGSAWTLPAPRHWHRHPPAVGAYSAPSDSARTPVGDSGNPKIQPPSALAPGLYNQWMFGGSGVPHWTAFTIGYDSVKDYRHRHPGTSWAALTSAPHRPSSAAVITSRAPDFHDRRSISDPRHPILTVIMDGAPAPRLAFHDRGQMVLLFRRDCPGSW